MEKPAVNNYCLPLIKYNNSNENFQRLIKIFTVKEDNYQLIKKISG